MCPHCRVGGNIIYLWVNDVDVTGTEPNSHRDFVQDTDRNEFRHAEKNVIRRKNGRKS